MGLTIRWDITNRCNLHCKHCSAYDDLHKSSIDELTTKEILAIMDQFSTEQIDRIKLLGGEPLLRDDLGEIITAAHLNNIPIGITTNGTIPFNEQLQKCITTGMVEYITFSLDSENDMINATLRPLDTVEIIKKNIKNINLLKQKYSLSLKVAINCIINNKNYSSIGSILEFAVQNQIDKISFSNLVPRGRAEKLTNLIATPSQLIQSALIIADFHQNNSSLISIEPSFAPALIMDYVRIKHKKAFPLTTYHCRAATELCYINETGNLYPCESIKSKYMINDNNILEHSFREIWNSAEFNDIFQDIESGKQYNSEFCKQCKYCFKTCYPCLNWSMKTKICEKIVYEIPNIFEVI